MIDCRSKLSMGAQDRQRNSAPAPHRNQQLIAGGVLVGIG